METNHTTPINNRSEKVSIEIDMNNNYVKAVIESFHQFLREECTGAINADIRFEAKLKAANTLFADNRIFIRKNSGRFGYYHPYNSELVLKYS